MIFVATVIVPLLIVKLLKAVLWVPPIVAVALKITVPLPATNPPEVELLFVKPPEIVNVTAPLIVSVQPLLMVRVAHTAVALIVGCFPAVAIIAGTEAVGTPKLQLPAVPQSVEIEPFHVVEMPANDFTDNTKTNEHSRIAALVNLLFMGLCFFDLRKICNNRHQHSDSN